MLCAPALYDPAVTPPGQFAVANALPKGETFPMPAGHFEVPELGNAQKKLDTRILDFFHEQ